MSVQQWFGTYKATVHSNADPQRLSRVQLKIPQVLGGAISQWADPVGLVGAAPAAGTSVTAVFQGGDPSHPAYITNPVAGAGYLAPNGNGSQLTGITQSQIGGLAGTLALLAPLASPTFTGTVTLPDSSTWASTGPSLATAIKLAKLVSAPGAGTSGLLYGNTNGTPSVVLPSGLSGSLTVTQTDVTPFTITAAGLTQASKQWSIPAGDAKATVVYRLTNYGTFTVGNAGNSPNFNINIFGANQQILNTTGYPLSTFAYKIVSELTVLTTGSSGTANWCGEIRYAVPGVGTEQAWVNVNTPITVNTTAATTMSMNFGWGVTTGGPSLTSLMSIFERIGP